MPLAFNPNRRKYREFFSSGTFTVPADAQAVYATLVGGGGGGGWDGNNDNESTGGSGSDSYINARLEVDPGDTLMIIVGSGGAQALLENTSGSDGGISKITDNRGIDLLTTSGGVRGRSSILSAVTSPAISFNSQSSSLYYALGGSISIINLQSRAIELRSELGIYTAARDTGGHSRLARGGSINNPGALGSGGGPRRQSNANSRGGDGYVKIRWEV